MLACVDVHYEAAGAVGACVLFDAWATDRPEREFVKEVGKNAGIEGYVPGRFYRRELPCLLAVLADVAEPLEAVVIDGYVWLGGGRAGLGAHLFEAFGRRTTVVGVAKNPFAGNDEAVPVFRGGSRRELFVTAAGVSVATAAEWIRAMHGEHRVPTLLKRVDRLCRGRRA